MLVVKVEVHPGGDEKRAFLIGRLDITNVEDQSGTVSLYRARLTDTPRAQVAHHSGTERLVSHDRTRSAWHLIQRALAAIVGEPR